VSEKPTRIAVERALRQVGLSARQARRFVAVGWPAVVGEVQADRDDLAAQLARLQQLLSVETVDEIRDTEGDLQRCVTRGEARSELVSDVRNERHAEQEPDERGLAVTPPDSPAETATPHVFQS
jgi:hypothetical protein